FGRIRKRTALSRLCVGGAAGPFQHKADRPEPAPAGAIAPAIGGAGAGRWLGPPARTHQRFHMTSAMASAIGGRAEVEPLFSADVKAMPQDRFNP
ncbi:hypothetical protein, partial [Gemmobacter sp.]|uniref:hypothetical protein n=1 Tax=Gemmobacter sp. TaxID=1898957 RepID=UPI0025C46086